MAEYRAQQAQLSGRNQVPVLRTPTPPGTRRVIACESECPVCHDTIKNDAVEMRCNHRFHAACLSTWLAKSPTCPICRISVEEDTKRGKFKKGRKAAKDDLISWEEAMGNDRVAA